MCMKIITESEPRLGEADHSFPLSGHGQVTNNDFSPL